MRLTLVLFALIVLSACGGYPRDVEATTDRVRAAGIVRVGVVAGDSNADHRAAIDAYVTRIEAASGARRRLTMGASEPLFARLDHGDLDLVIGEFADDTPWLPDVAFVDPLAELTENGRTLQLMPAARNGENRWIMLLEKVARDRRSK